LFSRIEVLILLDRAEMKFVLSETSI